MPEPSHHRAVALVLTVVLAIGLARTVGRRAASAPTGPDALHDPLARAADPDAAATDAAPSRVAARAGPVDPNTADPAELARLPGIGPTLARRIVDARDAGVRFVRAEDLRAVRGIGPRVLARIAPHLALPSTARPDASVADATDPPPSAGR